MRKLIWWGVLGVVICAAAVWIWQLRRPARPKAVFMIVVDTLRADRLSCYGYDPMRTAHIDSLAERGALFENAQANSSWTLPSMGSLMTSLYASQLGLIELPAEPGEFFDWKQRRVQVAYNIPEYSTTLVDIFRGEGFHTACFVNQPALNLREGYVQGFHDWFYPVGADTVLHFDPNGPLPEDESLQQGRESWRHVDRTDSLLVDSFVEWMETAPREDLFVWIHLLAPHMPYNAPLRFQIAATGGKKQPNPEPSDQYDGEVLYTDYLVGEIVRAIDKNVGIDQSLIVFTSDHGEEFYEHGKYDHGHSLHREVVQVPLIFVSPSIPPGERIRSVVRLIDVFPTMLENCGMSGLAPSDIEGVDLTPFISNDRPDLDVYAEGMLFGSTERSVMTGGFKLMWDQQGDVYRLYRTSVDTGEMIDIKQRFPAEARRLRTQMTDQHERLTMDFEIRDRARAPSDSLTAAKDKERILRALRSCGYLND
jgi:arylsulfatase A-like enzyme